MALYPITLVFLIIWTHLCLRDPDKCIILVLSALPFGMCAAMSLGSLSIIMAHFLVALTAAVFAARHFSGHLRRMFVPRAGGYLIYFGVYALFSALILVRLFAGEFLVFPLSFDWSGTRISPFYNSTVKPLAPTSSNIAQIGYIAFTIVLFLMIADLLKRRGMAILEVGMLWMGCMNLALGVLDVFGLDNILSVVRTADYALNSEQGLLGLPRAIAGFPEASESGAFAAGLFGYFGLSCLMTRQKSHGYLAGGNLLLAVMSFSSTGFLSASVAIVLILLHARHFGFHGVSWSYAHGLIIFVATLALGLSVAFMVTPLPDILPSLMNRLFFEKAMSHSGLERMAWARSGLNAFFETWGLGGGVGSLRASGWVSVILGSVGIPGAVLLIAFLWTAVGPVSGFWNSNQARYFFPARVAALTYLSGKIVSGTTPDPTLFVIAMAAIAAVARDTNSDTTTSKTSGKSQRHYKRVRSDEYH